MKKIASLLLFIFITCSAFSQNSSLYRVDATFIKLVKYYDKNNTHVLIDETSSTVNRTFQVCASSYKEAEQKAQEAVNQAISQEYALNAGYATRKGVYCTATSWLKNGNFKLSNLQRACN